MLLSYYINLVKLEMLWLSKILGMTYNLGWMEYYPSYGRQPAGQRDPILSPAAFDEHILLRSLVSSGELRLLSLLCTTILASSLCFLFEDINLCRLLTKLFNLLITIPLFNCHYWLPSSKFDHLITSKILVM